MKKITTLIPVLLLSYIVSGQTISEQKNNNYSEIETLKRAYFHNLRMNHDARIFSISEQRNEYIYKRNLKKRNTATAKFKNDSTIRIQLKKNQIAALDFKRTTHQQEIKNIINFRRTTKAIESSQKENKRKELKKKRKKEISNRNSTVTTKKNYQKKKLETKINNKHLLLKQKYSIPN